MPKLFDDIRSYTNINNFNAYVSDSKSKFLYSFETIYLYEFLYLINALGLISSSYRIYLACSNTLCIDFVLDSVECCYEW